MQDFKGEALSIISQFSGQANVISIPRMFIRLLDGDMVTAVFLSQCLYWQDRVVRKDGFFYKSMDEWDDEIALTEYKVRKATKKLSDSLGILETKLKKAEGRPIVHYRVNKDRFNEWLMEGLLGSKSEKKQDEPKKEKKASPDKQNAFVFYEENGFGRLSPYQSEEMGIVIDEYGFDDPHDVMIGAMKIAVKNNARKWNYVDSILRDWRNKGFKTLDDVKAEHEKLKKDKESGGDGKTRQSNAEDQSTFGF